MTTNLPVLYDPAFAHWQTASLRWLYVGPAREEDIFDRLVDPIFERPMYFDKTGLPITMRQWAELRELGLDPDGKYGEGSYQRVAQDTVGQAWVSTVWLGMDHGFSWGSEHYKPVIFETMIFGGEHDEATMRYCTEWEAIKGHVEAVADLRAGMDPWWSYGGIEDGDEWRMRGVGSEGHGGSGDR
jgi:hypothetical protein